MRRWLWIVLVALIAGLGAFAFLRWHRPSLVVTLRPTSDACSLPSRTPCRMFTVTIANVGQARATNIGCQFKVTDRSGHVLATGPMDLQMITGPDVVAGGRYVAPVALAWSRGWTPSAGASAVCVPRRGGSGV